MNCSTDSPTQCYNWSCHFPCFLMFFFDSCLYFHSLSYILFSCIRLLRWFTLQDSHLMLLHRKSLTFLYPSVPHCARHLWLPCSATVPWFVFCLSPCYVKWKAQRDQLDRVAICRMSISTSPKSYLPPKGIPSIFWACAVLQDITLFQIKLSRNSPASLFSWYVYYSHSSIVTGPEQLKAEMVLQNFSLV